jgi:hypothetical protein
MLTENQIQRVARLVRLAPHMNKEQVAGLLQLIRDLRAADSAGWMPNSAVQTMVDAVGDAQVRDIVNDLKGGRAEPGFLPPDGSPPKEKGSGWQRPTEMGSPPGIKYVDQLVDAQDAQDRRDLEKRLRGR